MFDAGLSNAVNEDFPNAGADLALRAKQTLGGAIFRAETSRLRTVQMGFTQPSLRAKSKISSEYLSDGFAAASTPYRVARGSIGCFS
jgi:hypothetical protein